MATTTHPSMKSPQWYRNRTRIAKFAAYTTLLVVIIIFIYPLTTMVVNSFKSNEEMYRNPVALPIRWTLESYNQIFKARTRCGEIL